MDVETLVQNIENDDEARAVLAILQRANAKPAVLVTLREGRGTRRYVVAREDEEQVRPLAGLSGDELRDRIPRWLWVGGQWLRSYGKVDEMYRSLDLADAVKVEEADRARVWGTDARA